MSTSINEFGAAAAVGIHLTLQKEQPIGECLMNKIIMPLRIIFMALATSAFLALSFACYIGSRGINGTVWEFLTYSVLGAGFFPWLAWVSIACYVRMGNLAAPLAVGGLILFTHYALFAFLAHSYQNVYIGLQVTEILLTAALIYVLKFQ